MEQNWQPGKLAPQRPRLPVNGLPRVVSIDENQRSSRALVTEEAKTGLEAVTLMQDDPAAAHQETTKTARMFPVRELFGEIDGVDLTRD